MKRKKVYERIDEERDYQDSLVETEFRHNDCDSSVSAELVLIKTHIDSAMREWANNHGDMSALIQIRKIAGIAVRCMERHGVVKRRIR